MEKLKILILPSWHPTDKNLNAGVFIMEQARLLAEQDLQVSIFLIETLGFSLFAGESKIDHELKDGVETYKVISSTVPKLGVRLINIWARLYEELYSKYSIQNGKADIIHAHGYIAGFAARRLSAKYGIPYVITEHNTRLLVNGYKWWHKNEISRAYDKAECLIAVGSQLKRQMSKLTSTNIQMIPNLVDEKVFFIRKESESKEFEFICVGGLDKRKRIGKAIRAFSTIKSLESTKKVALTIVGDGDEMNSLQKLSDKLGLTESIQFTGSLPLIVVADKMRKSNALITVSAVETFGKIIIEALACGTPVLTAESADPEKIITDGKNGVKVNSDLNGLPQAMLRMVEFAQTINPNELHNEVIEKYGKEVVLKQIISVYQKAMINSKSERNLS
jgi:glycosyltransferase involved in cell wall biosynthesis